MTYSELIENIDETIKGFYVNDITIEFYKSIRDVFVNKVKTKKDVVYVLDKLRSIGYKIIIISARSDSYYGDAYKICTDFLKKEE